MSSPSKDPRRPFLGAHPHHPPAAQPSSAANLNPFAGFKPGLDLVRITEAAALGGRATGGQGRQERLRPGGRVDAMRLLFNVVHMDGIVVIGEGEKDQRPMLYNGERLGSGDPPVVESPSIRSTAPG